MKHLVYESDIERYLVNRVKGLGGLCIKVGYDGLPDRLVLLPGGRVIWVELKREDGRPSNLQLYWASQLRSTGQRVEMPYSKEDVDRILENK